MLLEDIKVFMILLQLEHDLELFLMLSALVHILLVGFLHLIFFHLGIEADLEIKLILLPHLFQDMVHRGVVLPKLF